MKKLIFISFLCIILLLNTTIIENISYSKEENKFPIKIDNGTNPILIKTNDSYLISYENNGSYIAKSKDGINWNKIGKADILIESLIQEKNGSYMGVYSIKERISPLLWESGINLSFSRDGINWTKPKSLIETEWHEIYTFSHPLLIKLNNEYIVYYVVSGWYGDIMKIPIAGLGMTRSSDGINWSYKEIIYDINPIEENILSFSFIQISNISLIVFSLLENNTTKGYIITSNDLVNWSKPILFSYESFKPSLIQLYNNSFLIADNNGIYFSENAINWSKILSKNYTNPSLIQIDEYEFMVAYENNSEIWIDIFEFGKKENKENNMNFYLIIGIIILAVILFSYFYRKRRSKK